MVDNGKGENVMDDCEIKSSIVLPWDRFSNWIHCCCVVTFDLELGQAMEVMYPSHVQLSDKEKMNICYLSFPDSNSGCIGDTQFHFRIRQCYGRKPLIRSHVSYNKNCPITLQSDSAFYYGFVYFRQTKDKSLRRGYFQKSVVLLTTLPLLALFSQLVKVMAPGYFENGEPSLEAACHDIDQWPNPVAGNSLHLPIMGTVLQAMVPSRSDNVIHRLHLKHVPTSVASPNSILPSLHEIDIYSALKSIISHVQLLWELVLIGEPIIVMAASPSVTGSCVQALVNMISPLKYCYDFRPYFTIHDSEFREFTTRAQSPPPVILGVTNPFFAKTLQHWPHIIRMGEIVEFGSSPKSLHKLKKASSLRTLDTKAGVYTQYKAFLAKDKTCLKHIMKGIQVKRPFEAQNAILRRHFLEMTQSFMIPLERYMASLMPLQKSISPHMDHPRLRPFDAEEFLHTVTLSGPQLTSGVKGDWEGLYSRFFKSENFNNWYCQRRRDVNQKLQILHMDALSNSNLVEWIRGKEEVEIVDLILRIKEKLKFAITNHTLVEKECVLKLQTHLKNVVSSLPEDLQEVIKT